MGFAGLREFVFIVATAGEPSAIFSMNIEGMDAGEVGERLDLKHNIATRTGLHCAPLVHTQLGTEDIHGSVRFSIGSFNTEEQIESAIDAIAEIADGALHKTANRVRAIAKPLKQSKSNARSWADQGE